MIGHDGAVLDVGLLGVLYWPMTFAVSKYPTLYGAFIIDFQYPIDLDWFRPFCGVRQPLFPRLWRWLRRGRGPWIYDCLCVVLACLQGAGIDVPDRISSPIELFQWLKNQGYQYVHIQGEAEGREALHRALDHSGPNPLA